MAVIGRGSSFLVGSAVTLLATFALRAAPRHDAAPVQPAPQAPAAAVDFARDVQPILERHCYECHGTEEGARPAAAAQPAATSPRAAQTGPVVVAGDTEQSLLMRRVLGLDGEDRMPLDADPLSDAELATLRGWIASGAVMPAARPQTHRGRRRRRALGLRQAGAAGAAGRVARRPGCARRSIASSSRGSTREG